MFFFSFTIELSLIQGEDVKFFPLINTSSSSLCLRSEGALREQISKPLFELPKFLINLDFTSRSHSFCDFLIEWFICCFFLLGQGCSGPGGGGGGGLKMIGQYLFKIIG